MFWARCLLAFLVTQNAAYSAQTSSKDSNQDKQSLKSNTPSSGNNNNNNNNFNPLGPLVKCSFLPDAFIECHPLVDHKGNKTARDLMGHGCVKFGGSYHKDVEHTKCGYIPIFIFYIISKDGCPQQLLSYLLAQAYAKPFLT